MTFSDATKSVAPYERLALFGATGSRIVNFNNPSGVNAKTKRAQLETIKKIVETLPPGSYSLAGKVSIKDEPVLFPFSVNGDVEIMSEPMAMDYNSELYRKVETLQRELLDARLQSQEANLRCEMLQRRNDELMEELESMDNAPEPMSQGQNIFETILQHAAPAIVNKVLGSDFLSDDNNTPSQVPLEAVKNAEQGFELLEQWQNAGKDCNNITGREQGMKLINREDLSQADLAHFRSFLNRAETYYDEDQKDCGTISYLLWGGDAMKDFVNSL
tara:strand:- start:4485 stop:5306 length:822 start_codon:yes stop_codon:yes gene_type:complete